MPLTGANLTIQKYQRDASRWYFCMVNSWCTVRETLSWSKFVPLFPQHLSSDTHNRTSHVPP